MQAYVRQKTFPFLVYLVPVRHLLRFSIQITRSFTDESNSQNLISMKAVEVLACETNPSDHKRINHQTEVESRWTYSREKEIT